MAKEWILNSAMNRWGLNQKKNVGPTSENIRICSPKTIDEWQEYYYKNVFPEEHLEELGKKLYVKITEVLSSLNSTSKCNFESVREVSCGKISASLTTKSKEHSWEHTHSLTIYKDTRYLPY